jgi:hypothetical protein
MYRLPFVIVCRCSLWTSSSYSPGRSCFPCPHSASGVFLLTVFALKYPPPHPPYARAVWWEEPAYCGSCLLCSTVYCAPYIIPHCKKVNCKNEIWTYSAARDCLFTNSYCTALLTGHFLNVIPTRFGVCLRHFHGVCGCVLLTQACIVSEITVFTHNPHS